MATIYLLNGVSSAGKTSIGSCLQAMLPEPYLQVQLDDFEDMIPNRYAEGGDFSWGNLFPKLLKGYHASLAALAHSGNNLIADHVMVHREGWASSLDQCLEYLSDHVVYFVGVHCDFEELERRELARGDRFVGTVKRQLPLVHLHGLYDIEVDTTEQSAEQCAQVILAFSHEKEPFAFDELRKRRPNP